MIKGKCKRCGRIKRLTKHSKRGKHKPPYDYLCRECHDKVDGQNKPLTNYQKRARGRKIKRPKKYHSKR